MTLIVVQKMLTILFQSLEDSMLRGKLKSTTLLSLKPIVHHAATEVPSFSFPCSLFANCLENLIIQLLFVSFA